MGHIAFVSDKKKKRIYFLPYQRYFFTTAYENFEKDIKVEGIVQWTSVYLPLRFCHSANNI